MKYIIFDELKSFASEYLPDSNNLSAICFCVFDSLDFTEGIKNHLELSCIGDDNTYKNKNYVHYTEDHPNQRIKFTQEIIQKNSSFKGYIVYRLEKRGETSSLYNSPYTLDLLRNSLKKLKKQKIKAICLIFEEGKKKDYEDLIEICKKEGMKVEIRISAKTDLYSSFPDYIIGIIKDYIIGINKTKIKPPQRSSNPPGYKQNLKLIYRKISHLRIISNGKKISVGSDKNREQRLSALNNM